MKCRGSGVTKKEELPGHEGGKERLEVQTRPGGKEWLNWHNERQTPRKINLVIGENTGDGPVKSSLLGCGRATRCYTGGPLGSDPKTTKKKNLRHERKPLGEK